MKDLIIIGMGPAGMSAGIYAKRGGLDVLIIEKSTPAGLVNSSSEIDNYLGFYGISGPDLALKFFEHINHLEIPYIIDEVTNIKNYDEYKIVYTKNAEYKARFIIIATGRTPRLLGLENETKLLGRGISTCALCDGAFFKDLVVAVVGGGNSALNESLHLAKTSKKVYLIHRRSELRGENDLQQRVNNTKNIEIIYGCQIKSINEEENKLKSITLDNEQTLEVNGLFIYIGFVPKTNFIENLINTNEQGYILVDENFLTNIPGIYAVGDIIQKKHYQVITAASDGAMAVVNILDR